VESGGAGPGPGLDGPLARHLSEQEAIRLLEATKAQPGDLVLVVSDQYAVACAVLGTLRSAIGGPPVNEGPHRYVWVVDFPMFEEGADGTPQPAHHPFTMPYAEDMALLATDPLAVRSQAYDLVLNGWELGSGSVRIHRRDVQEQVFAALGIGAAEAEARFGFLLGAFRYGAPPHAGFAVGLDRLVAILAGEENIREVIAYPKTQSGADPLTGAPTPLPPESLAELGIRVVVPPSGSAPGSPGAPTSPGAGPTPG
jgi:aspartyl-tRNA synthetase